MNHRDPLMIETGNRVGLWKGCMISGHGTVWYSPSLSSLKDYWSHLCCLSCGPAWGGGGWMTRKGLQSDMEGKERWVFSKRSLHYLLFSYEAPQAKGCLAIITNLDEWYLMEEMEESHLERCCTPSSRCSANAYAWRRISPCVRLCLSRSPVSHYSFKAS